MQLLSPEENLAAKVRETMVRAVRNNLAEGLLFSGGLDTGVIAGVATKLCALKAFTVGFESYESPDVRYSRLLAKRLGFEHHVHNFGETEVLDALPQVTKIMKSYCPVAVRSGLSIYLALNDAKSAGQSEVMTGDGGDERFLGYDHLYFLPSLDLNVEIADLMAVNRFASNVLGEAVGVAVKQPFLDREVKDLAQGIASEYKIRSDRGKRWGKWIVRKAFEADLPPETVWRDETVIEKGSGTVNLTEIFEKRITDGEFYEQARRIQQSDGVILRSKEQLTYYLAYREELGVPHLGGRTKEACPDCRSDIPGGSTSCRVCGHVFVDWRASTPRRP